jgi:hypothetical protein
MLCFMLTLLRITVQVAGSRLSLRTKHMCVLAVQDEERQAGLVAYQLALIACFFSASAAEHTSSDVQNARARAAHPLLFASHANLHARFFAPFWHDTFPPQSSDEHSR